MIVGILGENEWGQALATLVAEAGHIPKIGKESNASFSIRGFVGTPQWSHLTKEADLIIFANSNHQLRADIAKSKLGPRNHVLVNAGLHTNTMKWTQDLVTQYSPAIRVGVLGGAQLKEDVRNRTPTSLVVASKFDSVNHLAQQVLHSDICRIYFSPDSMGINLVSLFVQIIHLSIGISDGLQCGAGTRGAIVSRGLIEGARLGKALGAEEHSFLGIAGIGQLIATLEKSSFYQYGLTTITDGKMPSPALELLEAVLNINDAESVHLPLTKAIYALGKQEISPTLLIDGLMRRKATRE
jgi:glycerol-3-phosphate dehydrogenase (NAD(P)+)